VHGDLSETFFVGDVDDKGKKLVDVTKLCLDEAISICRPGQDLSMIGKIIRYKCFKFHLITVKTYDMPCLLPEARTFG